MFYHIQLYNPHRWNFVYGFIFTSNAYGNAIKNLPRHQCIRANVGSVLSLFVKRGDSPFSPFDSLKEFSWLPTSFALLFALFAVSLVVFAWSCNELTLSQAWWGWCLALCCGLISIMSSCNLVISSCSFSTVSLYWPLSMVGLLHSVRSEPIRHPYMGARTHHPKCGKRILVWWWSWTVLAHSLIFLPKPAVHHYVSFPGGSFPERSRVTTYRCIATNGDITVYMFWFVTHINTDLANSFNVALFPYRRMSLILIQLWYISQHRQHFSDFYQPYLSIFVSRYIHGRLSFLSFQANKIPSLPSFWSYWIWRIQARWHVPLMPLNREDCFSYSGSSGFMD